MKSKGLLEWLAIIWIGIVSVALVGAVITVSIVKPMFGVFALGVVALLFTVASFAYLESCGEKRRGNEHISPLV